MREQKVSSIQVRYPAQTEVRYSCRVQYQAERIELYIVCYNVITNKETKEKRNTKVLP